MIIKMRSLIVNQILVIKIATVNMVVTCPSTVSHDSAKCKHTSRVYLWPLVMNNILCCWTNIKNNIENINIVTYVELAVIMNFIRYIQTEKDMCTFVKFGLAAIRPRNAVCPRPV